MFMRQPLRANTVSWLRTITYPITEARGMCSTLRQGPFRGGPSTDPQNPLGDGGFVRRLRFGKVRNSNIRFLAQVATRHLEIFRYTPIPPEVYRV